MEPDLQPILEYVDALYQQFQIVSFQRFLGKNVPEYLHGGLGGTPRLNDGVPLVREHTNLVIQPLDLLLQVGFQLVIGLR